MSGGLIWWREESSSQSGLVSEYAESEVFDERRVFFGGVVIHNFGRDRPVEVLFVVRLFCQQQTPRQ